MVNGQMSGSKVFEYFILAKKTGSYELPVISLVSFSPKENDYVRLEKKLPWIEFDSKEKLSFSRSEIDQNVFKNKIITYPIEKDLKVGNFFLKNPFWQHVIFFSFFLTFVFWKKKSTLNKLFYLRNAKKTLIQRLNQLANNHQTNHQNHEQENFKSLFTLLKDYLTNINSSPFKGIKEFKNLPQKKLANAHKINFVIAKMEYYEKMIYGNQGGDSLNFLQEIEKILEDVRKNL